MSEDTHIDLSKLSDDALEAKRRTYLLSQANHAHLTTPTDHFLHLVAIGWLDAIADEARRREAEAVQS